MDVEKLLAAIEETERIARAANSAPWIVDNESYAETIYTADGTCVIGGGRWGGEASVFDTTEDALHIVRNDPAAVLRRCRLDRDTVQDYQRALGRPEYTPGAGDVLFALRMVVERLALAYSVSLTPKEK